MSRTPGRQLALARALQTRGDIVYLRRLAMVPGLVTLLVIVLLVILILNLT